MEKTTLSTEFIKDIENQESLYWSEYYLCCTKRIQGSLSASMNIVEGAVCCAMPVTDTLAFNRVIGIGMDYPINNDQLEEIKKFYKQVGAKRFMIQVSPIAQPNNFDEILKENGFVHHNNWAKLYKEIDAKLPEQQTQIKIESLELRSIDEFDEVIHESFLFEEGAHKLISQTYKRPGWKHYLAREEGKPVAAASLFMCGKYASLAIAGTIPNARGKGVQSALITKRINDAVDAGCEYIVVETSEDKQEKPSSSFRNMQRFGFELAYLRPNYVYQF